MRLGVSFLFCLICFKSLGALDSNQSKVQTDSIKIWLNRVKKDRTLSFSQKGLLMDKALDLTLSTRLNKLYKISSAALTSEDSLLFRNYNRKVIQLASQLKQGKSHAFAHWDLADFFKLTKPDSAFYHYQEAYNVFNSMKLDGTNNHYPGRVLVAIGRLQDNIKDYIGSEKSHIEAIRYFEKVERLDKLYGAYNGLAISQGALNKNDKSLEYYEKAKEYIPYREKSDQERSYLSNENNIYAIYLNQKEYKKAYNAFNSLISKKEVLKKHPRLYAIILGSWAYSGIKDGATNFKDLEAALVKSNQILDSISNDYIKARNQQFLGELFVKKGDTLEAIHQMKIGQQLAEQTKNYDRLLEILKILIVLDKKNATTYFSTYSVLNDEIQQKERIIQDKFARIRMETDEIIVENESLAKQKEIYAGIALGLLVFGIGIFTIVSQRINNQKLKFQQKQQKNNQEIYNLMLSQHGKLEEGKKSEKKRISEELHDGILGQMLGIRLILSGLNDRTDEAAIAQRAELIVKLQELEEEVRTISHELNSSAYEKVHNFMLSIQELINNFKKSTTISMSLNYCTDYPWDSLEGDVKINVYRVIQECLQNCIKHSKCKNVRVSFESSEKMLNLEIVDDGVGFDNTKGKKGIGLKNIISRVKKIKGLLEINSQPDKGSTIKISFPNEKKIQEHLNSESARKTVQVA